MIFVAESRPCEGGEGGKEDERGVEEDMAGLGNQAVFEGDEERGEEGGGDTAVKSTESEVS